MQENLFEQFIIKCCEMDEWDLRDFLKEKLKEVGFSIQEDNYVSPRHGKYKTIRNMLAIRGEKPRVCLVAHTDVCRDHSWQKFRDHKKAQPVIKDDIVHCGELVRGIQDRNCMVQVGGDDRLGVAINTWIALNTGYDMGLLFTTDEEIGGLSAEYVNFKELREFDLLCQVDRGNQLANQLVVNIYGERLCDNQTATRLLRVADSIDLPRYPVSGLFTDVAAIKEKGRCKNAVNMSCGYYNSIGASPNEYIVIEDAQDTLKYVASIVNDYEMETINDISNKNVKQTINNRRVIVTELKNIDWVLDYHDMSELIEGVITNE